MGTVLRRRGATPPPAGVTAHPTNCAPTASFATGFARANGRPSRLTLIGCSCSRWRKGCAFRQRFPASDHASSALRASSPESERRWDSSPRPTSRNGTRNDPKPMGLRFAQGCLRRVEAGTEDAASRHGPSCTYGAKALTAQDSVFRRARAASRSRVDSRQKGFGRHPGPRARPRELNVRAPYPSPETRNPTRTSVACAPERRPVTRSGDADTPQAWLPGPGLRNSSSRIVASGCSARVWKLDAGLARH